MKLMKRNGNKSTQSSRDLRSLFRQKQLYIPTSYVEIILIVRSLPLVIPKLAIYLLCRSPPAGMYHAVNSQIPLPGPPPASWRTPTRLLRCGTHLAISASTLSREELGHLTLEPFGRRGLTAGSSLLGFVCTCFFLLFLFDLPRKFVRNILAFFFGPEFP